MIISRKYDLDALRGVMMLLGVVLHSAASFVVFPLEELWPYKFTNPYLFFDALTGTIHLFRIPVFYILSGYFIMFQIKKYDFKDLLINKIKRIVLPFLFGLFILAPLVTFCFYLLITDQNEITRENLSIYWANFKFYTAHFWFLYYLIVFYIIHLISYQVNRLVKVMIKSYFPSIRLSFNQKYLFIIAIQIALLYIYGFRSIDGYFSLLPPVGSVIYFCTYYFLGTIVYRNYDLFCDLSKPRKYRWMATGILLLLFLLFQDFKGVRELHGFLSFVDASITVSAVHALVLAIFGSFRAFASSNSKSMQMIAQSSYTIYVFHLPILIWIVYFIKSYFTNAFLFFGVLLISVSALSFVMFFIKKWIEKVLRIRIL